jgi:tRNA(Ile)-lysidine synthase
MKSRPTLSQRRAGLLGVVIPREHLQSAVLAWAAARAPRERWGVALSGGADSVALLLLLWAHWPERRGRLVAFHFDHRLRGAESRLDAVFCRRLCAGLGVPLVTGYWAQPLKTAGEAAGRAARFDFFEDAMRLRRMKVLWLGHQQDDVAESMLMRLARGSGSAGLAAPRAIHEHLAGRIHVRPLLTLKKAAVCAALLKAGVPWREDPSNSGEAFFRNRVRKTVVPIWCDAAGRDALAGAALSRQLLEEDDVALERWVDRIGAINAAGSLNLARLRDMPRAVVRRALHRWLARQAERFELSRQAFELLLAATERGEPTRQSLGLSAFAVINKGRLSLQKRVLGRLESRRLFPRRFN